MGYVLGIDLGTTYSAAATHREGRAQIVSIGSRTAAVPSVVFLRQDEAILTGEAAERRALTEPGRVAREFKRRLGDTTPIMVGGTPYSAEQLSAELLKTIVGQVVALEGGRPDYIAVCHPANWGPYKKELMEQAVELAGLTTGGENIALLSEPEAAAIHYASTERLATGELLAVYDLGGGTFDAAVLRKTATGFEMLGDPKGIERLGGIDFDAAVLNHVRSQLGGALDTLDQDDPTAIAGAARLRDECIEAKEALSSDSETSIPVLLPNVMTEVRLTRSEFESLIRPALSQTIDSLQRTLQSANVQPEDISRVLLVGGSSRIPLVGQLVSEALGRPVVADAHPKHAIALGAAIAAAAAAGGLDTAAAADATVLLPTAEEASLTRTAAAATAVTGVAALPHPAAAGWEPDPTGRHQHRYFDGTAWTDDVADAGGASRDPLVEAAGSAVVDAVTVAAPGPTGAPEPVAALAGKPPPPSGYVHPTGTTPAPAGSAAAPTGPGFVGSPGRPGSAKRRGQPGAKAHPVQTFAIVAVAVVVVIGGVAFGISSLGGGGGGGGAGTGNFSSNIGKDGGTFVHHMKVKAGTVLLVKAIPGGTNLEPTISIAASFQTIDKFQTSLRNTPFGEGAQKQADLKQLSDVALSDTLANEGLLFVTSNAFAPGQPKQLAMPVPFDADLDVVISFVGKGTGKVDLLTRTKTFPVPVKLTDNGITYNELIDSIYTKFEHGQQDIDAAPDFKNAQALVADSDFTDFSNQFSSFSDPQDAFSN
jgi:actin-like ATPase involved in cell morphogenesis